MAAPLLEPAPVAAPTKANAEHMSKGHSCPTCGTQVSVDTGVEDAQRKISALEAQIELLNQKATAAVDKCADYEDQLRNIRATRHNPTRSNTSDSHNADLPYNEDGRPSTANSISAAKQSRFSFLTSRRGSPAQLPMSAPPAPAAPSAIDTELLEQLENERALRAKAEERAKKVDSEIEELSVQLFSQANEMVAEERRARAKLEARVEQLEQKDRDKMARLERLEKAVSRLDRVKALLAAPKPGSGSPQRKS